MGWLIALGVLVVLAILPLGVKAVYDSDGFLLEAKIGPIPIRILPKKSETPQKEKKKKEKKPTQMKGKKAASASASPKPKQKKGGSWTDFLPLVKTALDFLDAFRQKLRIRRLQLKLIMAGDDPCDLAVNYGRAWAALGNLIPQLERCFVIKKRDLEVECDFEATKTLVIAHVDISITFGRLIWIAVKYGLRAVKDLMNMKKLRKGGASK